MNELDTFLRAAKGRGASDEFLVAMMKERGWPAAAVYESLGQMYAEDTGLALPEARGKMESAREAFFHLLAFATLGTWIWATGSLWFTLIDTWFPDAAAEGSNAVWRWSRVNWEMASLIVAFPAFVWATRAILQEMDLSPDKAGSAVRRWLTNIALLIAALVFIGDLVTFVAAFLKGELTIRFELKSLTVFVLAGAVFLYYNRGLARDAVTPKMWHKRFAGLAATAIVVSLGLGMLKTGSPAEQRLRAEDQRRLRDLHRITEAVHFNWLSKLGPVEERVLAASLDALPTSSGLTLIDPFTKAPYEYAPGKASQYSVCAVFNKATEELPDRSKTDWTHPQGRHCFGFDASRQIGYPRQLD